jgi:AcrR family transcriptional regulator
MSAPVETIQAGTVSRVRTTQRSVLVATAERLFAEQGIDAVSLRTVMAEAGTNVAAVRYHFGTKDDLVEAVVRARSEEIKAARDALLTALEESADPSLRDLAEAFVLPLAGMATAGDVEWIRLVAGVTASGHPALAVIDEEFAEQSARLGLLLRRINPGLDPVGLRFRLTVAMTLTYRTLGDLADLRTRVAAPGRPPVGDDRVVSELVAAVASILG